MLKKIKELFCSSLCRADYIRITPKIRKANLTMTTVLSMFASILIAVMFLISLTVEGFKQNRIVYLFGLAMSLTISLLSVTVAKKHYVLVSVLIFLSYTVYYLYGILIGAVTDPTGKTVTFMVLLMFMPTLFIEKPAFIITVTGIHVSIFVMLCLKNKTGSVLTIDLADSIVFALLGLASGIVVNNMKIKSYLLELKLQELSSIDKLTNVRNRNAFEFERDSIGDSYKYIGVAYIDVNGLHELNNEKGHDAGDEMLKYIAFEISNTFTTESTYRIGGDEFVAFAFNKSDDEVKNSLKSMIERIEKRNYNVAVGFSSSYSVKHINVDSLINDAEKKMILNKQQYYKNMARQARNS